MKIVVYISQTLDTEARVSVSSSGDSIDTEEVKWILNPYDEFAVEEALRTREKLGGEVIIATAGPARAIEAIRQALAMGADSGLHIKDEGFAETDNYTLAKIAASEIKKIEGVNFVLTGMKVIDDESVQVPVQLAEELNIAHVSLVSKVVDISESKLVCQKEIDGGAAVVEVSLPVLITCPDAMNEPRYASLPGIMKAKKKPVKEVTLDDIDFDALGISRDAVGKNGSKVKTVKINIPEISRKLKIIKGSDDTTVKGEEISQSVKELVKLLKDDAKVI